MAGPSSSRQVGSSHLNSTCSLCNAELPTNNRMNGELCGHLFHATCVTILINQGQFCPVTGCSRPLSERQAKLLKGKMAAIPQDEGTNHLEVMHTLLALGSEAILTAFEEGRPEVVEELIDCGAALPSKLKERGRIALLASKAHDPKSKVGRNFTKLIQEILSSDPTLLDQNTGQIVFFRISQADSHLLAWIFKTFGQKATTLIDQRFSSSDSKKSWTPLVRSIYVGNLDSVEILLDAGARLDAECGNGLPYPMAKKRMEDHKLRGGEGSPDYQKSVQIHESILRYHPNAPEVVASAVAESAAIDGGEEEDGMYVIERKGGKSKVLGKCEVRGKERENESEPTPADIDLIKAIESWSGNSEPICLALQKGADPFASVDGKNSFKTALLKDQINLSVFWALISGILEVKGQKEFMNIVGEMLGNIIKISGKEGNIKFAKDLCEFFNQKRIPLSIDLGEFGNLLIIGSELQEMTLLRYLVTVATQNDLDTVPENMTSPLHTAIKAGNLEAVELLLCNGANPRIKVSNMSAAMLAKTLMKDPEDKKATETRIHDTLIGYVKRAIEAEKMAAIVVDPRIAKLASAADRGRLEEAKQLIEEGTPFSPTSSVAHSLMKVAISNRDPLVEYLREKGVKMIGVLSGSNILRKFCKDGDIEKLRWVLDLGAAQLIDKSHLETAVEAYLGENAPEALDRREALLTLLLEVNASLSLKGIYSGDLLRKAIPRSTEFARQLIARGADAAATCSDGATLLHAFARADQNGAIEFLLETEAKKHLATPVFNLRPLELAVRAGSPVVQRLLEHNAPCDALTVGLAAKSLQADPRSPQRKSILEMVTQIALPSRHAAVSILDEIFEAATGGGD